MTPKQAVFVDEYLVDLNASQAAVRAGYKGDPNTVGPRLWANVGIQEAIQQKQLERQKRTEITQDLVLTDIELIKRDAMREALDKEGNKAMINHTAALKACELQGRHLQMWNDKLALMNKDGTPLLQNLTVNLVRANGSD